VVSGSRINQLIRKSLISSSFQSESGSQTGSARAPANLAETRDPSSQDSAEAGVLTIITSTMMRCSIDLLLLFSPYDASFTISTMVVSSLQEKKSAALLGLLWSLFVCAAAARDFQKGLAMHTSQSCRALEPHTSSSWWYSWSATAGFTGPKGSFCDQPETAVSDARASGMEFVPMFWYVANCCDLTISRTILRATQLTYTLFSRGTPIPQQPFSVEVEQNLQEASYLLTFNEPEMAQQSNISPEEAAQIWPQIVSIAESYTLQLVAPCATGDKGLQWYTEWLGNCTALYPASSCTFHYTCMHLYYQPWDEELGSCAPGVHNWACIGNQAAKAVNKISQWFTTFGKPTWLTEFACAPWGGATCDEARHTALMEQMLPILDDNSAVFRYSWYSTFDGKWIFNSLNKLVWESYPVQACINRQWIKEFGLESWKIQTLHECVESANENSACASPLSLSIDNDNCYCAVDECTELQSSYSGMVTYKEVGIKDSNTLMPIGSYYNADGVVATESPSVSPSHVPTDSPTNSPSAPPTKSPVRSCFLEGEGIGCDFQTNCCAGVGSCTGGKPANRVCTAVEGPPTTPAPAPTPTGGGHACGGNKAPCLGSDDCCSGKCNGQQCQGNRRLGQQHVDRQEMFL